MERFQNLALQAHDFGFARYPEALRDINGRVLLKTSVGDRWFFHDFVDSPDPRFRKIVKRFAEAGYVKAENDEFSRTIDGSGS